MPNSSQHQQRLVVFLGAGVSKPLDLPVTTEIFPAILKALRADKLFGGDKSEQSRFRKLFRKLFPGINLDREATSLSITSVLSLVDHFGIAKLPPGPDWQMAELTDLQMLLERAVCEVINRKNVSDPGRDYLQKFVTWLDNKSSRNALTIITTNYDISLEKEIFDQSFDRLESRLKAKTGRSPDQESVSYENHCLVAQRFDFGFEWRYAANTSRVTLFGRPSAKTRRFAWYKLHGSFNWLKCELCGQIYVNTDYSIVDLAFWQPGPDSTCHCGRFPLRPVIVAPSLVRDIRDSNLLEIWRHSQEALRQAARWIFIGYSFPQEDIAIRSLLLRAFHGHERRQSGGPKITVVTRGKDKSALTPCQLEQRAWQAEEFSARVRSVLPTASIRPIGAEGVPRVL